jgi:hypothetical protein
MQVTQKDTNRMEGETTVGEIYDEVQDRLALARTRALMGEREEALGLLRRATLEFTRFRDILAAFPGFHALEHALTTTRRSLEQEAALADSQETALLVKPKRKSKKAA